MPTVKPKPPEAPFWRGPWCQGIDKGRVYSSRLIARTRAERKKNGIEIRLYHDDFLKLSETERREAISALMKDAIVKLGLFPDVLAAAKTAMLHGWEPQLKQPSKLVTATR